MRTGPLAAFAGAELEEARRMFAELRRAGSMADPAIRQELTALAGRILEAVRGPVATVDEKACPELTVREIDVLAHVAIGCRNGEIAAAIGVTAETVKGYLRSTMTKLGVHSRLGAVECARARGLIP